MKSIRRKLGDFIEIVDEKNSDGFFGPNDLKGISVNKELINTKANTDNLNLKGCKILRKNWFSFCTVTSRNGNRISVAFNDDKDCITSSFNPVFKIKDTNLLNPRYLMMFFNRGEFDRYARANSWGSAREYFWFSDMCDVYIDVPPIEIQEKYVAIYEGILQNLKAYESGYDDLKLVCDGFIESLRKKYPLESLKDHIEYVDERNKDGLITNYQGIDNLGNFIEPKRISKSPTSLKIVKSGDIVYNRALECVTNKFSFAYRDGDDCAVSNSYIVFRTKDANYLLDKYIILWTNREEFARYAKFISFGTAHENFEYTNMEQVRIPIPPIEIQQSIINIYDCLKRRQSFKEELSKLKSILCPILIRGAVDEAKRRYKNA